MLNHSIKFNYAKFEYYVLHITPNTALERIKSKLLNFSQLDQYNNNVVLAIEGKFESTYLTEVVQNVKQFANQAGVHLHSILKNEILDLDNIAGVAVVNLPQTKKSIPVQNKPLMFDEPVRSGMKLENDGDIIISSFVSDNAEVMASGNIHIYGEAKGRLIAGSAGNKEARIFTSKFNAELIAIGGIYKIIEDKLPANIDRKPVMIILDDKERLNIVPL
jgi:septum site-determining protein MinC